MSCRARRNGQFDAGTPVVYTLPMLVPTLVTMLLAATVGSPRFQTEFERSGGTRTGTYQQAVDLCRELDRSSRWVRYRSFGTSGEGRDLPVLIVDRHGRFTPAAAHRDPGNAVVLVQAGIHAGEIDGKDAGLMLVRAMTVEHRLASLLDHVTLVFVPILNVDGHERTSRYNRPNQNGPEVMGFRANASELNLNRDYLKADSPEIRSWLGLFNEWSPDLFVDCHVTDGADYQYVITYVIEEWQDTDSTVAAWSRDRFEAPLTARMASSGFPIMHYCDFRTDHDPRSGLRSFASTPRFSTGYVALRDRPALLIEAHMLKDYATRVRGTYAMLENVLGIVNDEHATLHRMVAAADARTASPAFRRRPLPLTFDVSYQDSAMIDFLGYDYDVVKSEVTGGKWFRYSHQPERWRVPYFYAQRTQASATLPAAYVIPPQWKDVIARLDFHGVHYTRLTKAQPAHVSTVRFTGTHWREQPYEGRHPLTYDTHEIEEDRVLAPGTVIVDTAQPSARVIANLLEPVGPDALVRWGFFDASFEYKEYIESYVIEAMIPGMLARDPQLQHELGEAKKDPDFASNPDAIRRWFYARTPYFEHEVGVYPVARIRDRAEAERLLSASH